MLKCELDSTGMGRDPVMGFHDTVKSYADFTC